VEPATFGGGGNAALTVSTLAGMNVPSYLIKRDVELDISLHRSALGLGARNLR
jgi:hypothetical protein